MMKTFTAGALFALLVGCHVLPVPDRPAPRAAAEPEEEATPIPVISTDARECVMQIEGVAVTSEETPSGAALVFTTTGDMETLRGKVVALADEHNQEHLRMGMEETEAIWGDEDDKTYATGAYNVPPRHDKGLDDTNVGQQQPLILTHSKAILEPFGGGIRLVFVADEDNLEALRDEVSYRAEQLAQGTCD